MGNTSNRLNLPSVKSMNQTTVNSSVLMESILSLKQTITRSSSENLDVADKYFEVAEVLLNGHQIP